MARPRFTPTDEHRRTVRLLVGLGLRQEEIAQIVGLKSAKTLRSHFRSELDRGRREAHAKVAQTLFRMATSGKCVAATVFYLKTQANWRERPREEEEEMEPISPGKDRFQIVIHQPPRSPEDQAALDELTRRCLGGSNVDDEFPYERLPESGAAEPEAELPPDLAQKYKDEQRRKEEAS